MDDYAVEELEELLEVRPELQHIKVRKHGKSLILYSGIGDDRQNHARFTHLGDEVWGLSFPHHTGRWAATPIEDSLENLLSTVARDFSFYLRRW